MVEFLAEPTEEYDGRIRAADDAQQHRARRPSAWSSSARPSASTRSTRSTPTATATRSWCSTRPTSAAGRAHPSSPSSSTCATGCWSRAVPEDPELLASGDVVVPGVDDGALRPGARAVVQGRGRDARLDPLGERVRPGGRRYDGAGAGDLRRWTPTRGRLDDEGVLRPGETGCLVQRAGGDDPLRRRQCRRPALRDDRVDGHDRRRGAGRAGRRRARLPRPGRGRGGGSERSSSTAPGPTARSSRSTCPTRGSHVVQPGLPGRRRRGVASS